MDPNFSSLIMKLSIPTIINRNIYYIENYVNLFSFDREIKWNKFNKISTQWSNK